MDARALLLATLVASVSLAGCISEQEGGLNRWEYEPPPSPPSEEPEAPNPTLLNTEAPPVEQGPEPGIRFIALGDQGTGKEDQYAVAEAVGAVCAERGCDFAVALGDNIYESGVSNEYDPQFEEKFELPYRNLTFPFYMTLGNHDNSCDPITCGNFDLGLGQWYDAGDHEVAYHYRNDRVSDKWQMPARFYGFEAGDEATFFSLDTNTLMYFGLGIPGVQETYRKQERWIERAIADAETPWRIVFGHHPYRSNGQHGDAGNYEEGAYEEHVGPVDPETPHPAAGPYVEMFYDEHICGRVDLILSGHDHDLQWLPAPDCGYTQQIVSGAAAKTRGLTDPERNEADFQQGDILGFYWIEIVGDELLGAIYDVDGTLLFEQTIQRPSLQSQ